MQANEAEQLTVILQDFEACYQPLFGHLHTLFKLQAHTAAHDPSTTPPPPSSLPPALKLLLGSTCRQLNLAPAVSPASLQPADADDEAAATTTAPTKHHAVSAGHSPAVMSVSVINTPAAESGGPMHSPDVKLSPAVTAATTKIPAAESEGDTPSHIRDETPAPDQEVQSVSVASKPITHPAQSAASKPAPNTTHPHNSDQDATSRSPYSPSSSDDTRARAAAGGANSAPAQPHATGVEAEDAGGASGLDQAGLHHLLFACANIPHTEAEEDHHLVWPWPSCGLGCEATLLPPSPPGVGAAAAGPLFPLSPPGAGSPAAGVFPPSPRTLAAGSLLPTSPRALAPLTTSPTGVAALAVSSHFPPSPPGVGTPASAAASHFPPSPSQATATPPTTVTAEFELMDQGSEPDRGDAEEEEEEEEEEEGGACVGSPPVPLLLHLQQLPEAHKSAPSPTRRLSCHGTCAEAAVDMVIEDVVQVCVCVCVCVCDCVCACVHVCVCVCACTHRGCIEHAGGGYCACMCVVVQVSVRYVCACVWGIGMLLCLNPAIIERHVTHPLCTHVHTHAGPGARIRA